MNLLQQLGIVLLEDLGPVAALSGVERLDQPVERIIATASLRLAGSAG
jgi:hypothetical protein